ncbi:hypothetical protein F444_06472 [Phytophthora nicotianae P1976]|uniref:HTH CENPB-type domain-containing protein n=1 Tax=Phytophthora nicotianae P1976 TaxID=1317066 RepID=A0A081AIA3_PHYNI|nr:hypothetical protein F444_06472 [Phytophthora nicotianae P1976]
MLNPRVLDVAKEIDILNGYFAASISWVNSFTRRHRFSFLRENAPRSRRSAAAIARVKAFAKEVARVIAAEGITDIFNADQTVVFFESLPRTTLTPTGSKTVRLKCGKKEKERMTAVVMGDVDGNKYSLFLVMKALHPE